MPDMEVIGIMSGTSLDGVDLAHCAFERVQGQWTYRINGAQTIPYTDYWQEQLSTLEALNAYEFQRLDIEYGAMLGTLAKLFMQTNGFSADLIASHGHTAYHNPGKRISKQIGDVAGIGSVTKIPVVGEFRQGDVLLGGQGAPLAPIGDLRLFGDYPLCLNLGGIANITLKGKDERNIKAFDVAPCNLILNHLARKAGQPFDDKGTLARTGTVDSRLLETLNNRPFYTRKGPKSLDKQAVYQTYLPLLENSQAAVNDLLATLTEHIAGQVGSAAQYSTDAEPVMLVTGGGAYNDYLLERIQARTGIKLRKPSNRLIQYKEALIFAFMGLLRCQNIPNCLRSVTGASEDHVGGILHGDATAL